MPSQRRESIRNPKNFYLFGPTCHKPSCAPRCGQAVITAFCRPRFSPTRVFIPNPGKVAHPISTMRQHPRTPSIQHRPTTIHSLHRTYHYCS